MFLVMIDGNDMICNCFHDLKNEIELTTEGKVNPSCHPDDANETVIKFDDGDVSHEFLGAMVGLVFYQFAEVETLILNKQKKRGHLNNCKYTSESNEEIIIVDSTWFTNLVKSDGFNVRGHFAFRAHGEGRKERRLVWISGYEKSSYTREAGISRQGKCEGELQ